MRWLLVVFVFNVGADRQPQEPVRVFYKSYFSEIECNRAGPSFREIFNIPVEQRSISACIPEDAYGTQSWRVID